MNLGYELDETTLRIELEVRNAGSARMPAGMGLHPYFSRTLTVADEQVALQAKVGGVYTEVLPTAPAVPISAEQDFSRERPLGDIELDTCFADWDGYASIHWPGSGVRAEIDAEVPLRHLILFTPRGKPFFAIGGISPLNAGEVAAYIDHTILKPEATLDEIRKLCSEARTYGFASVCINPTWVREAAEFLRGSAAASPARASGPAGSRRRRIRSPWRANHQ